MTESRAKQRADEEMVVLCASIGRLQALHDLIGSERDRRDLYQRMGQAGEMLRAWSGMKAAAGDGGGGQQRGEE